MQVLWGTATINYYTSFHILLHCVPCKVCARDKTLHPISNSYFGMHLRPFELIFFNRPIVQIYSWQMLSHFANRINGYCPTMLVRRFEQN